MSVSEDDIKVSVEKTKKSLFKFWEKKFDVVVDDELLLLLFVNEVLNVVEMCVFENILCGKSVKDFLDGSRSRLFFVS